MNDTPTENDYSQISKDFAGKISENVRKLFQGEQEIETETLNDDDVIASAIQPREFLGKKMQRSPGSQKKLLQEKKLGNMKCDEIDLENDKYNDDLQIIFKYAEENPFKVVLEFSQKFHWAYPMVDTFEITNEEDPEVPLFKTAISLKNNTFRGEGVGLQKKLAKST